MVGAIVTADRRHLPWRKNCPSWVLIRHTQIYYGKQESQYVIHILSLGTAYDGVLEIRLAKSQDYVDNEIVPLKTHTQASSVGIR